MEERKKTKKLLAISLILIISVIFGSSFVSAFGIGSAYHKDNPLKLSPGETKEIIFNLQNMPGPESITVRPSIRKGSEILELINTQDILVAVGNSIDVIAKVTVPNNAKIGDVYPVEVTFTAVTAGNAGTFGLGSSVGRNFDVIIVPTEEETAKLAEQKQISSWRIYLIIGIVILILAISAILFRLKKKI